MTARPPDAAPPDAAPAEPCVCVHDRPACGFANHGRFQLALCTRSVRHDGDHVACGPTRHRIATWPQVQR